MEMKISFEKYVSKQESNGKCWIWEGNIGNHGYGRISFMGTNLLSHRVAYELYSGSIPIDRCVLHKCNNRLCVNPDHLYLGDAQDNARDWIESRHKEKSLKFVGELKPLVEIERSLIVDCLEKNGNSRSRTSKELNLSTTTLWRKIKKYNIA